MTSAGRDMIDSAVGMVETAKHLAANPQDPAAHHSYSAVSHKLSENIKTLLTAIRSFLANHTGMILSIVSLSVSPFVVLHVVAEQYILQEKCLNK